MVYTEIINNVIRKAVDSGANVISSNPTSAVGPKTIVTFNGSNIAINDKKTGLRIYDGSAANFFVPNNLGTESCDVIYDCHSKRFIIVTVNVNVTNAQLNINTFPPPPYNALQGINNNGGLTFPPAVTFMSGNIVLANPINANTPLVNSAAINGNIALVATDSFTGVPGGLGSIGKGNNCAAAGATGVIFYASSLQEYVFIAGPTSIPSIIVDYNIGQTLLNNLTGLAGSANGTPAIISNKILFAVSKDCKPKGPNDWYKFSYDYTDTTDKAIYDIKLGINKDYVYVTSGLTNNPDGEVIGSIVQVFNKSNMLNGVATRDNIITLNGQAVLNPVVPSRENVVYFTSTNGDPTRTYNFLPGTSTSLRIFYTNSTTLNSFDIPYPVSTSFNHAFFPSQPVITPSILALPPSYEDPLGSIHCSSLWIVQGFTPSSIQAALYWYEVDIVSKTLKKSGVVEMDGVNTLYPTIKVDKYGRVIIALTLSSLSQAPLPAFIILGNPEYYTPLSNTYSVDFGTKNSPAPLPSTTQYSTEPSIVLDCCDNTMYYTTEYSSQDSNFVSNGVSNAWTISIVKIKV